MKLMLLAIFFYFVSTTVVESFLISALIGFKIGYLLANSHRGRSHGHGHHRYGRSVAGSDDNSMQIEQIMLQASLEDNDDCAKSFVCYVNTKPILSTPVEEFVFEYFGAAAKEQAMLKALMPKEAAQGLTIVDALSPTVQFVLAARIGKIGGPQQCQRIYAQCPLPYSELQSVIEGKVSPQPQSIELVHAPEQH
jgi:hypothetical protein